MDTDPDVTIQKAKRPISEGLNWGQRDRQCVIGGVSAWDQFVCVL